MFLLCNCLVFTYKFFCIHIDNISFKLLKFSDEKGGSG
nr:MAG TPA: hypothetical protein [Bacteriophage sp.]